tara:strand:+ start:116 stop:274 length:159 start_codon:yes stop_codon:yes gene_type:complete
MVMQEVLGATIRIIKMKSTLLAVEEVLVRQGIQMLMEKHQTLFIGEDMVEMA